MRRPIYTIAEDILINWDNISPEARSYVNAMLHLHHVNDKYIVESGRDIVTYFLANAGSWRGATARKIKRELKTLLA